MGGGEVRRVGNGGDRWRGERCRGDRKKGSKKASEEGQSAGEVSGEGAKRAKGGWWSGGGEE